MQLIFNGGNILSEKYFNFMLQNKHFENCFQKVRDKLSAND